MRPPNDCKIRAFRKVFCLSGKFNPASAEKLRRLTAGSLAVNLYLRASSELWPLAGKHGFSSGLLKEALDCHAHRREIAAGCKGRKKLQIPCLRQAGSSHGAS